MARWSNKSEKCFQEPLHLTRAPQEHEQNRTTEEQEDNNEERETATISEGWLNALAEAVGENDDDYYKSNSDSNSASDSNNLSGVEADGTEAVDDEFEWILCHEKRIVPPEEMAPWPTLNNENHPNWPQENQKYFEKKKRSAGIGYVRADKFTLAQLCKAFEGENQIKLPTLKSAYEKMNIRNDKDEQRQQQ